MRKFCERLFGKAAVVGWMMLVTRKPRPPVIELLPNGRESLLSFIEARQYPMAVAGYWYRIFG